MEKNQQEEQEIEICPECGGKMHPTCLGCGARYSCDRCGYTIPCSCTDFEL